MPLFSAAAPRVPSIVLTLAPGGTYAPPIGWYWFKGSNNSSIQKFDSISGTWRSTGHDTNLERYFYFDGTTTRIANPTGCAVAAVVTNAGSAYATPPTVTPSAGASAWTAIIGGALATLAVIGAAGSGYTYPPLIWIENPPAPGLQAAATAIISNGTISAVTINDQGAGYLLPPNVAVLNDWRDTTGSGGVVSFTLTGSGTVTGLACTNHGNPITSGTVPTLAFGSGAAAATVVMDWGITSVSITAAGAGYTNGAAALTATGAGGYVTGAPAYLGGASSISSMRWWPAAIDMTTGAGGGMSAVGAIIDPGRYQGIPTPVITAAQPPTTTGVLAFTMGGVNATVILQPEQQ